MHWLEAFHIIAIVCWFAGIFYLPRILVYYAASNEDNTKAQLAIMARKLFRFITPIAVIAILLGLTMLVQQADYYLSQGWMHLKLLAVIGLVIYHCVCGVYVGRVMRGEDQKTHVFYRFFNEIPVIFLVLIVIMVVVKPF